MDVSLQVGPNGFYFFERRLSEYGEVKSIKDEETSETKHRKKEDTCTLNENVHKSDVLLQDVSIQSTTGEVANYDVSPSLPKLQTLFAKKITPYYLSVEKKDRQKVLKMVYDITPPPDVKNLKTQTSESDFTSHMVLDKDAKTELALEMRGKSSLASEQAKESPFTESIRDKLFPKKMVCTKSIFSSKNISIQVNLEDFYEHKMDEMEKRMREWQKNKHTFKDTKSESQKLQMVKDEIRRGKLKAKYDKPTTETKTKALQDLKQFLLDEDVWDIAFRNRRESGTEKESFMFDKRDDYLEEDKFTVDNFISKLCKISSEVVKDSLTSFSEGIRLRDVAMELYWQAISPKNNQNDLQDLDRNLTYLELGGIMDKNKTIIESPDTDVKLLSHEKMAIARCHAEDIKQIMKRTDSFYNSDEKNVAKKTLLQRLLDAIHLNQRKLNEHVSRIVENSYVKFLTLNNCNKIEKLLDHEGVIYKYSELVEVIPHVWIGDFSMLKTPSKRMKNIHYRIILGDCKKCVLDQHDTCNARFRPYVYRPPFYTVNGKIHCMGIQAIDDARFPIFEYFNAACKYINKSLTASPTANVAIISESGKSRCIAILIAHLMIEKKYSLKKAIQKLKGKKAIQPNLGFMIQLIHLERELRRKRVIPNIKTKNVFAIRKKTFIDKYWLTDEKIVTKPAMSFVFMDDRMSNFDRRLGVNTNLLFHSPFSAPGPHFYKDIETSSLRTSFLEMVPFYKLDISSTRCDYKYSDEEGGVLASFSC